MWNACTIDVFGSVTINALNVNDSSTFSSYIDVSAPSYYGQIRVSHSTDGYESGIGFLTHNDQHITVAGDCWIIGNNLAQLLPNCFSIYCSGYGNCLTIDQYSNTTLSNILRVKNYIEMSPKISGNQSALCFIKIMIVLFMLMTMFGLFDII